MGVERFFGQLRVEPRITEDTWTVQLLGKFQNAIFWEYFKFLLLNNSYGSKTTPKSFQKIFQQIWPLEASKFLAQQRVLLFYQVSNDQKYGVKAIQSYDKHMLNISDRYLKSFLSNHGFTEKFWSTFAYVQQIRLLSAKIY